MTLPARFRLEIARQLEHQPAELHDADVGRAEVLARAVGDEALAVLDGGVLLGDALDAGEALVLLPSRSIR